MIIAEKKKKNKFLSLISNYGAHAIETIYAHGSVGPSPIAAAFGFESGQGRVIISCLLKKDKAEELIDILYKNYNFNKPNTGIAFSVTVEGLGF